MHEQVPEGRCLDRSGEHSKTAGVWRCSIRRWTSVSRRPPVRRVLNGRPIHASGVSQLSEALAAAGFPPNVKRNAPDLAIFLEMTCRCQAIRRTGSSALNLCYMAAGRYDVYWSYSTKIWDVAAGVLILREAGGLITSTAGEAFSLENAHFLAAANQGLHTQLHQVAASVVR